MRHLSQGGRIVLFVFLLIAGALSTTGCESGGDAVAGAEEEPETDPRIRLVGRVSLVGGRMIHSDVWGYVDPGTGKEYALVGGIFDGSALFVVDVSDPAAPTLVATVDAPGFDVKVWSQYAYTVTGGRDRGPEPEGRIIDLGNPASPRVVGAFPSAHNIFIDDRGYLYLEAPGLRIMDLNADPTSPTLVWRKDTSGGHDAAVVGDTLYDFHGPEGTFIYDVRARAEPRLLGTISPPTIRYHHSGWTTKDGAYLLVCDELAQGADADVTVWDIRAPDNPGLVAEIGDSLATVHNLYVVDDLAYVSYYTAGFRLYDVSDPAQPRLVDAFDTAPDEQGPGFRGAWGVYPFTPSGHIYVSDMANGLYVFALERQGVPAP